MTSPLLSSIFTDPSRHAVGLDLSGDAARFVHLRRKGNALELAHFGSVPLSAETITDGEVTNGGALKVALRRLLHQGIGVHLHTSSLFVALPERHTFFKSFDLQSTPSRDRAEAIRWELTQHVPYELKELYVDWTEVPNPSSNRTSFLLAAIPQTVANGFTASIEEAGYTILTLELPSIAVARILSSQFPVEQAGLILILGERESTAVLIQDRIPLLASALPFTMSTIDTMLAKNFELSGNDARKARQLLGLSPSRAQGVVRNLMEKPLEQLVHRIREVETYYQNHIPSPRTITDVLVCGTGALTAGLGEALSSQLGYHVRRAVVPPAVTFTKRTAELKKNWQEYVIALGVSIHDNKILKKSHVHT